MRISSVTCFKTTSSSICTAANVQLVAELKATTTGALGSVRSSLVLRHLLRRKQRTVTLSGVAARHGTGGSHSLISTGYCLRTNRSWFRILLVMLGAHLVSTQAPGSEGGITDNEPNTLQLRSPFPSHEKGFSSVHTALIDAVTLAAGVGPKALMVAADYVSSAGQSPEGRPVLHAVEGVTPSAFCQANNFATPCCRHSLPRTKHAQGTQ